MWHHQAHPRVALLWDNIVVITTDAEKRSNPPLAYGCTKTLCIWVNATSAITQHVEKYSNTNLAYGCTKTLCTRVNAIGAITKDAEKYSNTNLACKDTKKGTAIHLQVRHPVAPHQAHQVLPRWQNLA